MNSIIAHLKALRLNDEVLNEKYSSMITRIDQLEKRIEQLENEASD